MVWADATVTAPSTKRMKAAVFILDNVIEAPTGLKPLKYCSDSEMLSDAATSPCAIFLCDKAPDRDAQVIIYLYCSYREKQNRSQVLQDFCISAFHVSGSPASFARKLKLNRSSNLVTNFIEQVAMPRFRASRAPSDGPLNGGDIPRVVSDNLGVQQAAINNFCLPNPLSLTTSSKPPGSESWPSISWPPLATSQHFHICPACTGRCRWVSLMRMLRVCQN